MAIIQVEGLTKVYRSNGKPFTALENLNLSVNKGEIFGYLGPNGAGKTTTIRMLLDLIRPTSGRASILGLDTQKNSVELRRRVGYLPGELDLWKNERSSNIIRYFAQVRGGVDMNYVGQLAERFQFDMTKKVRDYSSGNKRKLGLILALMHKPELLILDEPTNGLDPLMQQIFNQLMREARDEGRTVFLSSHVLGEVQAICERVAVLQHGQLKAVERVDDLVRANFQWITLSMNEVGDTVQRLTGLPGVSDVTHQRNGDVRLRLSGDFDPVMRAVQDRYIAGIHVQEPTLEEIFLAFYDESEPLHMAAAPVSETVEPVKEMA